MKYIILYTMMGATHAHRVQGAQKVRDWFKATEPDTPQDDLDGLEDFLDDQTMEPGIDIKVGRCVVVSAANL